MAISVYKTFAAGEVLTAADLNNSLLQIINNPVDLWSPAGKAVDFDGQTVTLDAAAVTTIASSASQAWQFTPGAKTGTPSTTGGISNWVASTYTDNATAGSGTATAFAAHAIQRPTLAASNTSVTTTDAAVFYIANNVAAGTNETITNNWAVWLAGTAGTATLVRLDGALVLNPYGTSAGNTGELRCRELAANGVNYVGFKAADTLAGNVIWTLPSADGTNTQVLQTNGSGVLSFAAIEANPAAATQAEMETASSTTVFTTPGRTQYHPGVAKTWAMFDSAGSSAVNYNVASITDSGTGDWTVVIATDFSTANFAPVGSVDSNSALIVSAFPVTAGTMRILCRNTSGTLTDTTTIFVVAFGDQ